MHQFGRESYQAHPTRPVSVAATMVVVCYLYRVDAQLRKLHSCCLTQAGLDRINTRALTEQKHTNCLSVRLSSNQCLRCKQRFRSKAMGKRTLFCASPRQSLKHSAKLEWYRSILAYRTMAWEIRSSTLVICTASDFRALCKAHITLEAQDKSLAPLLDGTSANNCLD